MDDRIVTSEKLNEDIDSNIRPNSIDEYIGQADGNTPYYYFTNKTHPSYQIHPYLSSFVEMTDYTFAIENITNVAIDNVQKQLQKNIDNFIDDDGYLINTYRNPLNTNTDY